MKTALLASIALACATLASSPGHSADLRGARTFVAQLYAHYPEREGGPVFDPAGRSAAAVFDPSMVALIREDARLTPKGDVGALDGDPLCDCQDSGGLTVRLGSIRPTGASHAIAHVDLRFTDEKPVETRPIDLDLVDVGGHWRVYDVASKDMPSLRAYLVKSNRDAAHARRR